MELILLCACAFLAGFVDAVVGGGGLIQTPALLLWMPPHLGSSLSLIFGTNKLSSICGTSVAAFHYLRSVQVPWKIIGPATLVAFFSSWVGARVVAWINPALLKPIILVLLVLVAFQTYSRSSLGGSSVKGPKFTPRTELVLGIAIGAIMGFYDGFFGPGMGSFLIFLFVTIFGFDFLHASASAKVLNLATNASAVIYFASTNNIAYQIAIPMGLCNMLGSSLGSRLAILKGNPFVRKFFLLIVTALLVRFTLELL